MTLRSRLAQLERRLPQPLTVVQRGVVRALAAYAGDDPDTLRRRSRLVDLAASIRELPARAAGRAPHDASTTP